MRVLINNVNTPPSILLILSDDHAAWALHENPLGVATPHLDRLRAEGSSFTRAFTPSPVCSPARASLMTGLLPSEHGIHDWLNESLPEVATRDWLEAIPTLPQQLQAAGYSCFLSGKWHLGHPGRTPPGFDQSFVMSPRMRTHIGTDSYVLNGQELELEGTRSELITDQALAFLAQRDPARPFFLKVGYFATHSPYRDTEHDPRYAVHLQSEDFPEMPRLPPHPDSHPENGPSPVGDPEEERRTRWRGYAMGVAEIDAQLGRILQGLEEQGQLDSCVVVYTSDHGCNLGQNGIWGKGNGTRPVNFAEESLQVPLIFRGPGIPAGEEREEITQHLDTHVTLLRQAGLPGDGLPGQDLFSPAFEEVPLIAEYGDARMIRSRDWKLSVYADPPEERLEALGDSTASAPLPQLHQLLEEAFVSSRGSPRDGLQVTRGPLHNPHEPWSARRPISGEHPCAC